MAAYHIGTLIPASTEPTPTGIIEKSTTPDPIFLSKTKWKSAKLISIERVNHDSRNYRFALESPEQLLGLPTGQHVYARLRRKVANSDKVIDGCVVEGELVQRAYTPVSPEDAKGTLDMLIKVSSLVDSIECTEN